ncbi:hypothetical protein Gotri_005054, partial [Gossypium trilobum]|nr:hypothetical protein [Gossypium trilobum]
MVHPILANRLRTRRCLRQLAHAHTAMPMMIKPVPSHAPTLIIQLLSVLRLTLG